MRLSRLQLARYGKFTDWGLDFGTAEGKRDFHLIYGGNEAGKTTIFSACLDMLFGIEAQSDYNFLHDYRAMRLEAELLLGETLHHWVRVKGNQGTLRDARDQVVDETPLRLALGQLERSTYRTMFSLDDDSLEQGGESILQSEGDLGRLLFQATSGLSQLSSRLRGLEGEADAFYRKKARAGQLRDLREQLALLQRQRREADLKVTDFTALLERLEAAKVACAEAEAARGTLQRDFAQQRRLEEAREPYLRWLQAQQALPEGPLPPEPPADGAARLGHMRERRARALVQREQAVQRLEALAVAQAEAVPDEAVLACAEAIARLNLLERDYHAASECEAQSRRLEAETEAWEASLRRFGLATPPAEDALDALEALLTEHQGLATQQATLQEAAQALALRQANLRSELDALPDGRDQLACLEGALQEAGQTRLEARLSEQVQRCAGRAEALQQALAGLTPWMGAGDALLQADLPSQAQVEAWVAREQALAQQQAQQARAARESEQRLVLQRQQVTRARAKLQQAPGELARLREAREHAFKALTGALDEALSLRKQALATYKAALQADDAAVALQLAEAERHAALAQAEDAQALAETACAELAQEAHVLAGSVQALRREISEVLERAGLPPDWSARELELWLRRAAEAQQLAQEVQVAKAEQVALQEAQTRHHVALHALLAGVPDDLPPAALRQRLEMERSALQQQVMQRTQHEARLDEVTGELGKQRLALRETEARAMQVTASWEEALDLAGLPRETSASQFGAQLAELRALPVRARQLVELRATVQRHTAARERFAAACAELAEVLAEPQAPALAQAAALRERLRCAEATAKQLAQLQHEMEAVQGAQREAERTLRELETELAPEFDRWKVADLDALASAWDQAIKHRQAHQRCDELRHQVALVLGVAKLDAAHTAALEAAHASPEAHEARLKASEQAVQQQEEALHHARLALAAVQQEVGAVSGDASVVTLAEQHAALQEQLRESAREHLALRLGIMAVEEALSRYRERHRSAMMAHASEAFARMTLGGFRGLATQPGKQGDELVALRDSGSLLASQMSKGTRFQLYLALRIAGYHAFVRDHFALPVIADDILETFDDARSEQTFRLLGELSEHTQVIYLTHHAHLVPIAQRAVGPSLRLHPLPGHSLESATEAPRRHAS